jgi:hypothetical protein
MAHYRAALVFERWICAAVPIMPHYVNIAWEDYFLAVSFCLQGGAALWILLFTLKTIQYQKAKDNVPQEGRTKSMTKNKPEGYGVGSSNQKCGS